MIDKDTIKSTKKINLILGKVLKYGAFLFLFICLLYVGLGLYLSRHTEKIGKELALIINEKLSGTTEIGSLELQFFKGFPNITLQIQDVTVKDSLWNQHKKTLIKADEINAEVIPWAVFLKKIEIDNITLKNATITIFADEKGYSNLSVFSKLKDSKSSKSKSSFLKVAIEKIRFNDVAVISENHKKNKRFDFRTSNLDVAVDYNNWGWDAKAEISTLVKSLSFNTKHGSFAENKKIEGEIKATYKSEKGFVFVSADELYIGKNPFGVTANLGVSAANSKFDIHLLNKSIHWKEASSLLAKNIKSKLDRFDLSKPFDVQCEISGDFAKVGDPYIHVIANIIDSELKAENQMVKKCSFRGEFTNNYIKNNLFDDLNSAVQLHDFKGIYNEIPFSTKNLMILNLKKPIASGQVISKFELSKLNSEIGKNVLDFTKGKVHCNIQFKADVIDLKISKPFILGDLAVENAEFTYLARNLKVFDYNFKLAFTPDKLRVQNLSFKTKNSQFRMNGDAKNFMNLYYDNPEKIVLNWDIYCPKLKLEDFLFLLKPKNKSVKKKSKIKSKSSNEFLEKVLGSSTVVFKLNVNEFSYKKFIAKNTTANISVLNDAIVIEKVAFQKGNGTINLDGLIVHHQRNNDFNFKFAANKVDIRDLLYSFDNFGLSSITYQNVSGIVDINTQLSGILSTDGMLVSKSLSGVVNFNLTKGAFINFKPLQNVGKYVFPFRDFNTIKFEKIHGDFIIKNGLVTIQPMEINSSVINFDFGGTYAFAKGTNLKLDVYLKNPKKDTQEINPKIRKENRSKGLTVHLQAVDDDQGKIKIKLRSVDDKK